MKEKDRYIVFSIVLFVEILALMIFIYCEGDMWIKKILCNLECVTIGIFLILFPVVVGISIIAKSFSYTGDTVHISKDDLHYKSNFKSAKEIYIAKDVVNIPYKHFSGLTMLQYVEFEGENTTISENAFEGCEKLERVYLPSKLTKIKNETFKGCSSLEDIIIPDSLTYISASAFVGCNKIKYNKCNALYIGNKNDLYVALIKVEDKNITSYEIDINTKIITNSAFQNCKKLEKISIPDSVTRIGASAFAGCKGLTSVTIGNGVEEIGVRTFKNCEKLEKITIPDSVTKIGVGAFKGCGKLENVTFADTNNWYYTSNNDYTGGKKVNDISDLKNKLKEGKYYLYKKEAKNEESN